MIANFHTHTRRCNHATGLETEYIEAALQAGLDTLGFSDHAPMEFEGGYVSSVRMKKEIYPEYVQTLRALEKAYTGRIKIHVGLELEYYPRELCAMLPILKEQSLDYLILGQHFTGSEVGGHPSPAATADKKLLEGYVNQSIEGMQTLPYTYFAHPDMFHFVGDEKFYAEQTRRLCREAKSCGLPLEINLLGVWDKRNYPRPLFWQIAAQEGCQAILGRDAHSPQMLLDRPSEEKALQIIKETGITLLERVQPRKPW